MRTREDKVRCPKLHPSRPLPGASLRPPRRPASTRPPTPPDDHEIRRPPRPALSPSVLVHAHPPAYFPIFFVDCPFPRAGRAQPQRRGQGEGEGEGEAAARARGRHDRAGAVAVPGVRRCHEGRDSQESRVPGERQAAAGRGDQGAGLGDDEEGQGGVRAR